MSRRVAHDAQIGAAVFDHRFERDTEITGHARLQLWIEVDEARDADLFIALQKRDVDGKSAGMTFHAFFEDAPVALGWLRAGHRPLDTARGTELQPVIPAPVGPVLP